MKQTIEIEVPDGKKAVWKNDKIVFEEIKPQLPETWEEFCKQNKTNENEYYLNSTSRIIEAEIKERHIYDDRNVLPNMQAAEAHLALMQLHQLRDCYRQGWTPDWSDCNKNKYCILYNCLDCNTNYNHSITVTTYTREFLSFQSREIAQEFLNNFSDLIEQAGDLI